MKSRARVFSTVVTAIVTAACLCAPAGASSMPLTDTSARVASFTSTSEGDPSGIHTTRPSVLGEADEGGNLQVSITSITPTVLDDTSTLTVSGTLTNLSGAQATSSTVLRLFMSVHSAVAAPDLSAYFSGHTDAGIPVAERTIDRQLGPRQKVGFTLSVPAEELPLDDSFEWGPRGICVQAQATTDEGDIDGEDRSVVVWDSYYERQQTPISVLVPFTSTQAFGSTEQWKALSELARTPGVTLAVDPEALTSFVRTGILDADGRLRSPTTTADQAQSAGTNAQPQSTAPTSQSQSTARSDSDSASPAQSGKSSQPEGTQSGSANGTAADAGSQSGDQPQSGSAGPAEMTPFPHWPSPRYPTPSWWHSPATSAFVSRALDTLVGSGGQVVALPSMDADPARLQELGDERLTELARESMSVFGTLSTPEQVVNQAGQADSATSRTGSAQSVSVIGSVLWPRSSTFGLSMLPESTGRTIIAPAGEVAPPEDASFTSVTRVEVDADDGHTHTEGASDSTRTVLTSTHELTELLAWDAPTDSDELDARQAAQAMGALITRQLPNIARPQLVTVARNTAVNSELVSRIRSLTQSDWMAPRSFAEIATSEPTDTEREDVHPTPEVPDHWEHTLHTLNEARAQVAALATALDEPHQLTSVVNVAMLNAVSAGHDDDHAIEAAKNLQGAISELYSLVHAEPSATINVINKTAAFPVRVTNKLPWTITVTATLKPDDARLRATPSAAQPLEANSTGNVEVPVQAIGSGNIDVTYIVATPRGTILDSSQSVMVRLRAQWEDIGTWSIAGLVAVAFCVGLIRNVRSQWRSRDPLVSSRRKHTHSDDGDTP